MPRPEQMNINVATWGRLLKKNIRLAQSDLGPDGRQADQDGFAGEYMWQRSPENVVLVPSNSFRVIVEHNSRNLQLRNQCNKTNEPSKGLIDA